VSQLYLINTCTQKFTTYHTVIAVYKNAQNKEFGPSEQYSLVEKQIGPLKLYSLYKSVISNGGEWRPGVSMKCLCRFCERRLVYEC